MKNLADEIRIEIEQTRKDKNSAAASHAMSRYSELVGLERGLVWCLSLVCGEVPA